jgi:hypothetical protein
MTLRPRRSYFVVAIGLLAIVSAAALVSSGRAGSSSDAFNGAGVPPIVAQGDIGQVKAQITATKSVGGAISHLVITIDLPDEFVAPFVSNGCSQSLTGNVFTCDKGNVPSGQTATSLVSFGTPANLAPGDYPVGFMAAFDNGGGGQGAPNPLADSAAITIVAATDNNRDGKCSDLGTGETDTVSTGSDVNNANPHGTELVFGPAAPLPNGVPFLCTGVSVGDDGPLAGRSTGVSFVSAPVLAGFSIVTMYINANNPPKNAGINEYPNYPDTSQVRRVKACLASGFPPANEDTCLPPNPITKNGSLTQVTLHYIGTGGDPGYDGW